MATQRETTPPGEVQPQGEAQPQGEIQKGSCHCGAVTFEIHGPIRDFRRCDCSICRRKGAIMCTADKDQFRLVCGEEKLGLYQWNTKTARHYFCRTCGIYTHHWRRSRPEFGYNIGCIEGVDIRALPEVEIFNGQAMTVVGEADRAEMKDQN